MNDSNDYKTWLLSYRYQGAEWSMQVVARDEAEAMIRIKQCANYGKVDGELMATIPAAPGAGLLTRFICWLKN